MSYRGSPGPRGSRGRGSGGGDRGFGRGRGSGFHGGQDRGSGFQGGRSGPPGIFQEKTAAIVPQRLADNNLSSLIDSFKKIKITAERPIRPGFGTLGTPIKLRSNFFVIKLPKGPIYDYVVELDPPLPEKKQGRERIKHSIFEQLDKHPQFTPYLSHVAHDKSQRIVSARLLPQPLTITVTVEDGPSQVLPPSSGTQGKQGKQKKKGKGGQNKGKTPQAYVVNIKFDRSLDLKQLNQHLDGNPQSRSYDILPTIGALNLVLQQHASRTGIRVGKKKKDGSEKFDNKYFFPSSLRFRLEPGVEAVQGFYASVRPTYKELMINVNVCFSAFYEARNLADILVEFQKHANGGMPSYPPGRIKIRTKHLNRKKTIKKIGTESARNTRFRCDDPTISSSGQVTVEEYFLKKYKVRLVHAADIPLVDISTIGRRDPEWIPAELCDIEPGQMIGKKLSSKQTAQMIRFACNPPRVNADAIVGPGFNFLGFNPMASPSNGFGLSVDRAMAVVPARELPPPQVTYKVGKPNVKAGSWNVLDVKFHRGATVNSWWVVYVRDGSGMVTGPEDNNLRDLTSGFKMKCQRCGMTVPSTLPRLIPIFLPPRDIRSDPGRLQAVEIIKNTFKQQSNSGKPTFALVLLENRDDFIYPAIKKIGDTLLGIHTVHMQLEKAMNRQKQDQYFSNVALKLNTKLGGINHMLGSSATEWLTKEKTMLVGIDVTHPGWGSKEGTPSIAAVVASVDDNFVQFPASLRIQESKQEMLSELTDMLVERLLLYEKKNKMLPKRVIVFRDGVSEGQYDDVVNEEMPQIEKAFMRLSGGPKRAKYNPRLSIVVCGKRHHARFFAEKSEFSDRNGNTRPGTVVDKGITSIFDFDFYLQAHAGLQGSVKATHYTVVYDQIKLQADEIQQGTHTASYLYARATKAVSLVPPAYYADLACERGRYYLNSFLVDIDGRTSTASLSSDDEKAKVFSAAKAEWGEGLHVDMRETMFYI